MPTACSAGQFSTGPANTACNTCAAGSQCASTTSAAVPCPAGKYSLAGWLSCLPCPPGYACPSANVVPSTQCAAGTYSVGQQTSCTSCRAGFYCPQTDAAVEIPCRVGSYSAAGAASCTVCPAGSSCSSIANLGACSAGYYSVLGNGTCTQCPAGFRCPYTTSEGVIPCDPGDTSAAGSATCTRCPAGRECPDPTVFNGRPCSPGYYSLSGSLACTPCPRGFSCAASGTAVPVACPNGTTATGMATSCTPVPPGFFAGSSADDAQPCPAGQYALGNAVQCTRVPPGSRADTPGTAPVLCSSGTWSPGDLIATTCYPADAGYFTSNGSSVSNPASALVPVGYYFNPGILPLAVRPCPAGFYGNITGAGSLEEGCFPCPAGEWCLQASNTTYGATRGACPRGFYCPMQTQWPTQYPCPNGTYNGNLSSTSIAACLPSPAGFYSPAGSSSPTVCPAGYYCPFQTFDYRQTPCPAGFWSNITAAVSMSNCTDAPSTDPAVTGGVTWGAGQCWPGRYCPAGTSSPGVPCPAGTFNPLYGASSATACIPCTPGTICSVAGLTAPNGNCSYGYYCPAGTASGTQFPCPAGTFNDVNNATNMTSFCLSCPAGLACPQATGGPFVQPLACAAGYYCPTKTQFPTQFPCAGGSYGTATNLTSQAECTICPAGKYCSGGQSRFGSNADVLGNCARGYWCPANTTKATANPCPAGTWSDRVNLTAASECYDTAPGYYSIAGSSAPSPCLPGSYANTSNTRQAQRGSGLGLPAECAVCPAGSSCGVATVNPVACAIGTFSASGASTCSTCQAGYYCDEVGLTQARMLSAKGCPGGLYCPAGTNALPTNVTNPCPMGSCCPFATAAPITCDPGTFANVTTGLALCLTTPSGYYSLEGAVNPTGLCDPGYFCTAGSSSARQSPCAGGTYQPAYGGRSQADCLPCNNGTYCPIGSSTPQTTPIGSYSTYMSPDPIPCPIGTFGNITGARNQFECASCTPGWYCDRRGLITPTAKCEKGFVCRGGDSSPRPAGGRCPAGGFCGEGSSEETPCPPGSVNPNTGAESYLSCSLCSPAYYQPLQGQTTCLPCEVGRSCPTRGMFFTDPCPPGSYCQGGGTLPKPCLPGTFNNATGMTAVSACSPCTPGYYCATPGLAVPTGVCSGGFVCNNASTTPTPTDGLQGYLSPKGHYSPPGSAYPTACPPGTYQNTTGASLASACLTCPPKYFCPTQGLAAPVFPTHYCAPGYTCDGGSVTGFENATQPGYYSTAGSVNATACLAGTYQPLWAQSSCLACDAGYYCPLLAMSAPVLCPAGSYCPVGSILPTPCPARTYSNATGLAAASACRTCDEGFYCSTAGLLAPTGRCAAGWFCGPGSDTATP